GYKDGQYILNPVADQLAESDLDLVVAGTSDAVLMVESEAKELSEEVMLGAVMFGHREMQPVVDGIIALAEKCAKEPWDYVPPDKTAVMDKIRSIGEAEMREAYREPVKLQRQNKVNAVKEKIAAAFAEEEGDSESLSGPALKSLIK